MGIFWKGKGLETGRQGLPSLPLTWSQLAYGLGVYLRDFLGLTSTLASRIFDETVCGSYHTLSPALGMKHAQTWPVCRGHCWTDLGSSGQSWPLAWG